MKIRKATVPARVRLGNLKNGALFERADVETPCTTYMVCKHHQTLRINLSSPAPAGDCTYVVDLKNAVYKAMADDTETIPLEQDDEIVVREL